MTMIVYFINQLIDLFFFFQYIFVVLEFDIYHVNIGLYYQFCIVVAYVFMFPFHPSVNSDKFEVESFGFIVHKTQLTV